MKRMIVALGVAAMLVSTASAQTVKEKLGALEEGLNDANPIIRLGTLEEALSDSSKAVRTYAMSQALASDDGDMKELAITHFFTTKTNISIEISENKELRAKYDAIDDDDLKAQLYRSESRSFEIPEGYQPSVIYTIKSFKPESGEMKGYCMKNRSKPTDGFVFTGVLTGNKLSFEHECYAGERSCSINMELKEDAKFAGTMQCRDENYPSEAILALK